MSAGASQAGAELFDGLRRSCAEVAARARSVRLLPEALEQLAERLCAERPPPPDLDPAHRALERPEDTVAFVLTLDAVNFGSGWFPVLRKAPGRSGYRTIAEALRRRFDAEGPWDAAALQTLRAEDCARLFGQLGNREAEELMELFSRALRELGAFLAERHAGRFAGPVERAGGAAERLVVELARMPLYRDVARYQELCIPFYQRAQITVSDLAAAFGGRGLGRFEDLGRLTLFADNLVPHVLRMHGVLRYEAELAARIRAEQPIAVGSPEEVEIRAVALHAVEALVAACRGRGWAVNASRLDHLLWSEGQSPAIKAEPRHRTRCTFY